MYLMRFDMRAPSFGAPIAELYSTAVDMAEWGEKNGCIAVAISEHHCSEDGYLPSPVILASAIAARTSSMPIQVAAILLPFYEPLRLAEDLAVLDILSGGRVSYIIGLGYRDVEFEMFGVQRKGRGRRAEATIELLRRAWTGEPFELEGRRVHVTPPPLTPGGPVLMLGGSSAAAARRAARCGLAMYAQTSDLDLETIYREECAALGREPGVCMVPPPGTVTSAFVAEDVDEAWEEMGKYLLHDARMYSDWLAGGAAAVSTTARTVDELRAERGAYRIFSVDEAIEYGRTTGFLVTQPLCGGLPPELAWRSLHLIADRVLPALG
jgi:alkanesulfonate monooxygenase SsuD/methylene tetrahydromethanopterin reductase-like flavin-dependent oxidoreductase (luciferase family)